MLIMTNYVLTTDQLVALKHGELDLSLVPVATCEISDELAAFIAGEIDLDEDDEDDED